MVGARAVTLLIADFSGRAVVRLTSAGLRRGRPDAGRRAGGDAAPGRHAVRAGAAHAAGRRRSRSTTAPAWSSRSPTAATPSACSSSTSRGSPPPTRSPTSAAPRTPSPTSSSPPAGTPTSSSGGSARRRSRSPPRSSAGCCPRPTPARRGSSPSPAGWSRPPPSAGTPSTTRWTGTRLQVSITDAVGHQVGGGPARHPARRRPAQRRAGRAWTSPTQARYANDVAGRERRGRPVRHRAAAAGRPAHGDGGRSSTPATPCPLRLRDGRVEEVELRHRAAVRRRPGQGPSSVQGFPLEPGDRIVFLTDGMLERNAASLDVAAALADSADLHPREVVHELGRGGAPGHRRRPAGRRHDGLPRLVRRPAAGPGHRVRAPIPTAPPRPA